MARQRWHVLHQWRGLSQQEPHDPDLQRRAADPADGGQRLRRYALRAKRNVRRQPEYPEQRDVRRHSGGTISNDDAAPTATPTTTPTSKPTTTPTATPTNTPTPISMRTVIRCSSPTRQAAIHGGTNIMTMPRSYCASSGRIMGRTAGCTAPDVHTGDQTAATGRPAAGTIPGVCPR